jgi:hypothetical protein
MLMFQEFLCFDGVDLFLVFRDDRKAIVWSVYRKLEE